MQYSPKDEFLKALNLVLDSTYFQFENCFYKQKFGPMGSPLSPILADLVLQDIEILALKEIGIILPFYFRYMDDISKIHL